MCINCGKPSISILCPECKKSSDDLAELLRDQLVVEYADGTRNVFTAPDVPLIDVETLFELQPYFEEIRKEFPE